MNRVYRAYTFYIISTTIRIDAPGPPMSGPIRPIVWAYNLITTWLRPWLATVGLLFVYLSRLTCYYI